MSSRFFSNALVALFGGFIVVVTQAFRPAVVGWLGFAFGIAVVVTVLLAQLDRRRGLLQRLIDGALAALGGLAMGFGLGASGRAVIWTVFAFALGWVALSYAGLVLHEVASWRVRHGLASVRWLPTVTSQRPVHPGERAAA